MVQFCVSIVFGHWGPTYNNIIGPFCSLFLLIKDLIYGSIYLSCFILFYGCCGGGVGAVGYGQFVIVVKLILLPLLLLSSLLVMSYHFHFNPCRAKWLVTGFVNTARIHEKLTKYCLNM